MVILKRVPHIFELEISLPEKLFNVTWDTKNNIGRRTAKVLGPWYQFI